MRATSATGTIDFHIDEVQTKFLRASSTLEFSRTFAAHPFSRKHSNVISTVFVSSYIWK
jgi:hypothetical protein